MRDLPQYARLPHRRSLGAALQLATEPAYRDQPIFFGFLDRTLFALETEWWTCFLQDIQAYQDNEF